MLVGGERERRDASAATVSSALVVAAKAPKIPFFKVPPGHVWVESWGQEEIGPHGPAEIPAFYTLEL